MKYRKTIEGFVSFGVVYELWWKLNWFCVLRIKTHSVWYLLNFFFRFGVKPTKKKQKKCSWLVSFLFIWPFSFSYWCANCAINSLAQYNLIRLSGKKCDVDHIFEIWSYSLKNKCAPCEHHIFQQQTKYFIYSHCHCQSKTQTLHFYSSP